MSAADAFWHVLGLFLPALGTGLIAASFFAEWQLKRSIARAARAVSPDD